MQRIKFLFGEQNESNIHCVYSKLQAFSNAHLFDAILLYRQDNKKLLLLGEALGKQKNLNKKRLEIQSHTDNVTSRQYLC